MGFLDWILSSTLFVLSIGCLFTACLLTFRKVHIIHALVSIFLRYSWLIGALRSARSGSRYQTEQRSALALCVTFVSGNHPTRAAHRFGVQLAR